MKISLLASQKKATTKGGFFMFSNTAFRLTGIAIFSNASNARF
jgi:hypothetical protein